MPDISSDAGAVLAAGMAIAEAADLGPGLKGFVVPAGYELMTVDGNDEFGAGPRRKAGDYRVDSPDAFIDYLARHETPATEVWASEGFQRIEAVIDGHSAVEMVDDIHEADGQAGWHEHTVAYKPGVTPEWQAWIKGNGQWFTQDAFAEHIEDRAVDIVKPSAADMLELAQTFHATKNVAFKSSRILSSGERELEYREQVDASAGRAGRLEIPAEFVLALRPFDGADAFRVTARLRYRIADERLVLGWKLVRPEEIVRDAFATVVAHIADGVAAPVFMGARG